MPLRGQAFVTASFKRKRLTRVPKNGVSRSKRLLKPQPLPHQYWILELRTSLTKAGKTPDEGASPTSCVLFLLEVTSDRYLAVPSRLPSYSRIKVLRSNVWPWRSQQTSLA